jgi:hypothetical protein
MARAAPPVPFDGINGAILGRMCDSSVAEPIDILRERLQRDGFLLLRGMLPRAAVDAGCRRIAVELEGAGWLAPGSEAEALTVDPANLVWDSAHPPPEVGHFETQDFLQLPELARVLEAPEIGDFFSQLFREPSACFDFKWFRAIKPGGGQGFHCDNICELWTQLQLPVPSASPADGPACRMQIWAGGALSCTRSGSRGWTSRSHLAGWQ